MGSAGQSGSKPPLPTPLAYQKPPLPTPFAYHSSDAPMKESDDVQGVRAKAGPPPSRHATRESDEVAALAPQSSPIDLRQSPSLDRLYQATAQDATLDRVVESTTSKAAP